MNNESNLTWLEKRQISREAYLRRLSCYWEAKNFPRLCTHIGEIYEVDFGENVGSEFSGRHLAICLSETTIHQDRVMMVPLTTKYRQYNLKHIVNTTSFNGKEIKAGVMLNEARLVSKLRLFQQSLILDEDEDDGITAVAKIKLTKAQLNEFREVKL
jgi:mRNA-degrading endonuclease toxin of MazEF toxin-antitoxin module